MRKIGNFLGLIWIPALILLLAWAQSMPSVQSTAPVYSNPARCLTPGGFMLCNEERDV